MGRLDVPLAGQLDELQSFQGPLLGRLGLVLAAVDGRGHHIVEHRHLEKRPDQLVGPGYSQMADLVGGKPVDLRVLELNAAAIDRDRWK